MKAAENMGTGELEANASRDEWSYCLVRKPYQVRLKQNFGPGETVFAPESVIRGWELRKYVDRIPDKEVTTDASKRKS